MNKTKNKQQEFNEELNEEMRKLNQAYLQQKLYEGYTIKNIHGYTVYINTKGKQVRSNFNRNKKYTFSNPHFWEVLPEMNKDSIGYTLDYRFVRWFKEKIVLIKNYFNSTKK